MTVAGLVQMIEQQLPATLVPGDHLWQITVGAGESLYPVLLLCFERPGSSITSPPLKSREIACR